jgi:hypothetical protein
MSKDEKEKKEGLTEFESQVLRGSKRDILEESICRHLTLAIAAPPLQKIRYICDGSHLLPDEARKALGINEEELDTIYKMSISFVQTSPTTKKYSDCSLKYYRVSWSFSKTEESYEKFISPWKVSDIDDYYRDLSYYTGKIGDPKIRVFFTMCSALSEESYNTLESQFIVWAMPKAQRIFACLMKMMKPETFSRMWRETLPVSQSETAPPPEDSGPDTDESEDAV